MTRRLHHFLLVFDHQAGKLVHQEEFTNAPEAIRAYSDMELKHLDERGIEVVLIGSDSLETIRRTHANYFEDVEPASKYLIGL